MGGSSQNNNNERRSRSRSRSGGRHETNTGGYGSKQNPLENNDYFKNQEYWRQKREAASKAQT